VFRAAKIRPAITVHEVQHHRRPIFVENAEEIKKARAEKRLNLKLRKMEIEQKAQLLAEAKEGLEGARRKFEARDQADHDQYTPGLPLTSDDIFRAEKFRNDLIAMEREQKEQLYNEFLEKRARDLGDQWPAIQAMSNDPRFDHIPKPWPGYKGIVAGSFSGTPTSKPQESNDQI